MQMRWLAPFVVLAQFVCGFRVRACPPDSAYTNGTIAQNPIPQWVFELGARHMTLHNVAHVCALAVLPCAFFGMLFLAAYSCERRRSSLAGECLFKIRKRLILLSVFGLILLVVPLASYAVLSYILDGSLVWDCSMGPSIDLAHDRAHAATRIFSLTIGACVLAWCSHQRRRMLRRSRKNFPARPRRIAHWLPLAATASVVAFAFTELLVHKYL